VDRVDAVLFTHAHADMYGIDDLRHHGAGRRCLPTAPEALAERRRASPHFRRTTPRPGTSKPQLRPAARPDQVADVAGAALAAAPPHGDGGVRLSLRSLRVLTDVSLPDGARRLALQPPSERAPAAPLHLSTSRSPRAPWRARTPPRT
jgi:hypothetical protein